jgi:hypothetical protein
MTIRAKGEQLQKPTKLHSFSHLERTNGFDTPQPFFVSALHQPLIYDSEEKSPLRH